MSAGMLCHIGNLSHHSQHRCQHSCCASHSAACSHSPCSCSHTSRFSVPGSLFMGFQVPFSMSFAKVMVACIACSSTISLPNTSVFGCLLRPVYVTSPLSPMKAQQLPNSARSRHMLRWPRMTAGFVLLLLLLPCCLSMATVATMATRDTLDSPRKRLNRHCCTQKM